MLIRTIENLIFSKAAPQAINYLSKPNLNTKEPLARKVLDQSAKEFQLAPPITLHIADPDLMAGLWAITREAFIVNAKGRAMREAVAEAVSRLNQCPYCITIHQSMGMSANNNLATNQQSSVYQWASSTLSPDQKKLNGNDVRPNDLSQILATAVIYHYINRVVSVFLAEAPVALPGMKSKIGQKMMQASFIFFGRRITSLDPKAGEFLLPINPPLPKEFSWATDNKNISKAMAQFVWAAEKAGSEAVPKKVRDIVTNHIISWNGEAPALSRAWVDNIIKPLEDNLKPCARLCLLSALAPWQVDKTTINDFINIDSDDKKLLQSVCWASFIATKKIASWVK